jgi:hypothetical protein
VVDNPTSKEAEILKKVNRIERKERKKGIFCEIFVFFVDSIIDPREGEDDKADEPQSTQRSQKGGKNFSMNFAFFVVNMGVAIQMHKGGKYGFQDQSSAS